MKNIFLTILLVCITLFSSAQKYITKTGKIHFFSKTPLENIEATNNKVMSIIDVEKKQMVFSMLIKDFDFENQLMEDHFNEKYLESEKFPKSVFSGTIENLPDLSKDGTFEVAVKGKLVIHGVSQDVIIPGVITVKDGKVSGKASFKVKLVDHKIEVPTVVVAKIAEVIDITVEMNYELMKN